MYPTDVILFQVARMLMTKLVARQMGTMRVMNQSVVGKHSIFFSIFQYLSVFFKADREHVSDEPERGWKTFNVPIWKYFT